ncbi:MAG: hypothetical protein F6J93_09305 [Oscillatoria sp. SIO1A7]|nr:hypothetical protein [Oscillatoria sp. SIO1A7]
MNGVKQGRNDWHSWVSLRSTAPYDFKADSPTASGAIAIQKKMSIASPRL